MTRWTPSKDGVPRTDVKITFRLSAEELAELLAAQEGDHDDALDGIRTIDGIRDAVRAQLHDHGVDNLMDAEIDDVHHDAIAQAYGGNRWPTAAPT